MESFFSYSLLFPVFLYFLRNEVNEEKRIFYSKKNIHRRLSLEKREEIYKNIQGHGSIFTCIILPLNERRFLFLEYFGRTYS